MCVLTSGNIDLSCTHIPQDGNAPFTYMVHNWAAKNQVHYTELACTNRHCTAVLPQGDLLCLIGRFLAVTQLIGQCVLVNFAPTD